MIKELTHRLNQELERFTLGEGSIQSLDSAIHTAQEISEKLYILRYKAYEAGLFADANGEPSRQEFDLDLSLSNEEELPLSEKETAPNEIEAEEGANDNPMDLEPSVESTNSTLTLESTVAKEEVVIPEESTPSVDQSVVSETALFQDEPSMKKGSSEFDLMTLIHESKGKHEKIDAFNGNYSLKEKITFINALFGGSSESFGTAVKQIDGFKTLEESYPTLEFFASTFRWPEADPQTLSRFIEKLVAKYA